MSLVLDGTLGVQVPASSTGNSGAVAWVTFNGTNATIRASYNVGSVTRSSAGIYTVNITNALADTNYCIVTGSNQDNAGSGDKSWVYSWGNPTSTSFGLGTTNGTTTNADNTYVYAACFR